MFCVCFSWPAYSFSRSSGWTTGRSHRTDYLSHCGIAACSTCDGFCLEETLLQPQGKYQIHKINVLNVSYFTAVVYVWIRFGPLDTTVNIVADDMVKCERFLCSIIVHNGEVVWLI